MALQQKLTDLVEEGDLSSVLAMCEADELEIAATLSDTRPQYLTMLLCLYVQDDAINARYLWKRIPEAQKQGKLAASWEVGKAMWKNDYLSFYSTLRSIKYAPFHAKITAILEKESLKRAIDLVSRGYSHISCEALGEYLGMSAEDAAEYVKQFGWELEGSHVHPKPLPSDASKSNYLPHLQQLTQFATYVETQ
eukprot:TRINITY_DN3232_c0_g1_i2.p1 TRINITY_DN3232_c0_g1~~TRINITY_DN3232_c0_g1_i2.p1  ORF type:complete len:194 (+),score=39.82 TRINITY_DN3232_c0_g1_i2:249-830(+)